MVHLMNMSRMHNL